MSAFPGFNYIWRCGHSIAVVSASVFLLLPVFIGCERDSETREHPEFQATLKKLLRPPTGKNIDGRGAQRLSPSIVNDPILQAEKDLHAPAKLDRWAAVDALVKDGSARAVGVLAAYIESLPLDLTREEVVRRASAISDKRAIPSILELLYGAQDPSVFRMAQEVFIRVADAEAIQDVLDKYDNFTDIEFRVRLEKSIALASSEDAVEPLRLVVLDEGQPAGDGMVLASASALARIGTQPAVDTLLARLNAEQTDEGCSLMATRLGEVRAPSAETTIQGAALGGGKFSTRTHTRIAAISALSNYPSVETQALLASLASDPEPGVAAAATDVLGKIQRIFTKE